MIPVPDRRLLWSVAALVPAAAIAGPLPALWLWCLLALAGVVLIAALDLLLSLGRGRFPVVEDDPVVRWTRDRPGRLTLHLRSAAGPARRMRWALAMPAEFEPTVREQPLEWPAGVARLAVTWEATPRRRGRFAAGPACLESESVLGFWLLRHQQPLAVEIRVYPNLFQERRQLAALFLNRGGAGVRQRRLVGRGRDFERLREYQPGDSFDEVHWKGTAKRGRPVTKVFQVERTQEIYVVIDASRLSARAVELDGRILTALERQVTAALVLLLAAGRQGDRFGLLVHDAGVRTFLRAGNGTRHYGACREAVHATMPSPLSPDFATVFSFLRTRLRRRALLCFLTDLGDPLLAEEFTRHVRLISRQHLVLVNQIRSPGIAPVFADAVASPAGMRRHLAGHYQWREARDIAAKLQPLGVTARLLENEQLATELVGHYLQVKGRQNL